MTLRVLVLAFAGGFALTILVGFMGRFLWVAYRHGGLF
jgi:hypothetical protein